MSGEGESGEGSEVFRMMMMCALPGVRAVNDLYEILIGRMFCVA